VHSIYALLAKNAQWTAWNCRTFCMVSYWLCIRIP